MSSCLRARNGFNGSAQECPECPKCVPRLAGPANAGRVNAVQNEEIEF